MRTGGSDRALETFVLAPANDPSPDRQSSTLRAVVALLNSRVAALTPGTVVGTGVYVESKQVWVALLACALWPPVAVAGQVAAEWVRLLRPSRVLRRPRRRGS
jgi:hypothetical protein